MDEKLLTIGQAAEYLGVSLNTLRRWDESGKLCEEMGSGAFV